MTYDDKPYPKKVEKYVDRFERYARKLAREAKREFRDGYLSREELDVIMDYLGFERKDKR